jgi:membrane associated rhomboid family serine protease
VVKVKRINVASAFRVGALVFAMLWAVFGLLFMMVSVLIPPDPALARELGANSALVNLCSVYLCGVALYAVLGGVMGAICAFFYNVVAAWVGGLEITLERRTYMSEQELMTMGDRALPKAKPDEEREYRDL